MSGFLYADRAEIYRGNIQHGIARAGYDGSHT